MSTNYQPDELSSDSSNHLVNSLTYLEPSAYVWDALEADIPREEIIEGLVLFTLSKPNWPPGGNFDWYIDAVALGMFRPRYPNVLFRPFYQTPDGIFVRIKEGIMRKMGFLPDAIGIYDGNGNLHVFKGMDKYISIE